jgi:hypothetical protein
MLNVYVPACTKRNNLFLKLPVLLSRFKDLDVGCGSLHACDSTRVQADASGQRPACSAQCAVSVQYFSPASTSERERDQFKYRSDRFLDVQTGVCSAHNTRADKQIKSLMGFEFLSPNKQNSAIGSLARYTCAAISSALCNCVGSRQSLRLGSKAVTGKHSPRAKLRATPTPTPTAY